MTLLLALLACTPSAHQSCLALYAVACECGDATIAYTDADDPCEMDAEALCQEVPEVCDPEQEEYSADACREGEVIAACIVREARRTCEPVRISDCGG